MPDIIIKDRLFLAIPPLFKILDGKATKYAYSEKDKNNILKKYSSKLKDKIQITRFKGLGEMPADQLRDTTMDKNNRNLLQVKMDNNKIKLKKTEKIVMTLMGKNPELRFKYIQENADFVNNIDI